MTPRARHHHIRKVCRCGWRRWPKCPHAWYFSFKQRGGQRYRFSLDAELDTHFDNKTDAENAAADVRAAILNGTFRRRADLTPAPAAPSPVPPPVTLDQFAETYIERAVQAAGKTSWKDDAYLLATVRAHRTADGRRLGERALTSITEDELKAFHASQRSAGRAASTLNHLVQVLKAAFRWAARKGYLPRSPISDDSTLKRQKVAHRTRRLSAEEETALLAAAGALTRGAGVRLSGLIIGALETGCRRGELLSLQWEHVNLAGRELRIRGEVTKTRTGRVVPISSRLAAVLEMAKTDPDGKEYGLSASVFGLLGEPVASVKKAWETAVLRAYGHEAV